jgi:hypothetical protein
VDAEVIRERLVRETWLSAVGPKVVPDTPLEVSSNCGCRRRQPLG